MRRGSPKWLAAELAEAKKVGPYTGTVLPKYEPGKPNPVELPSRGPEGGWKVSTVEEWDKVFYYNREKDECGLSNEHWRALKRLHMDAYYASGDVMCDCTNVKDTIAMFRRNGLACTPWKQGRHFWGLKNSKKKARARSAKALVVANKESHDDAINRLAELLDAEPDEGQSHDASYDREAIKIALREAAGRDDFEVPNSLRELRALLPELLGRVGVCPDCLVEKLLIILEHAKGGPDDGRARTRDCKICNEGGRGATDVVVDAAHKAGETLTAEDHADVVELAIAYARPIQATRDAKERLAKALRMAAAATVEEDERVLAHVSTTRRRAAADDADDTYQARRAAAIEAEQARLAERAERDRAAAAAPRDLPTFRAKMRVVVKKTGARGVVQCTTCSGSWIHVELEGASGTTKGYRRGDLDIDTSRKPSARSARKPSARKPAAKKPSKKKARK